MSDPMRVAHVLKKKWRSTDIKLEKKCTFNSIVHDYKILNGLKATGFRRPSPVQVLGVPMATSGRDLIIQSKSGTGKTCLFVIRSLERINECCPDLQVLIVTPTREIAVQVQEVLALIGKYCSPCSEMFIGGLPLLDDINKLENCQIAVGTPGRLAHLIREKYMYTGSVNLVVLDEADHLMHMSFAKEIDFIMQSLPEEKQVLAVSATFNENIVHTFEKYMVDLKVIRIYDDEIALKGVIQFFHVVEGVDSETIYEKKFNLMLEILKEVSYSQCMVFSSTMNEVVKLCRDFRKHGHAATSICGCDEQEIRLSAVASLKESRVKILVTTNVTARGLDVEHVNLVLNMDPASSMEVYMHRVGRAGRFGSRGASVTLVSSAEVQKLLRFKIKGNFPLYPLPDPIPIHLKKYQPDSPELGDAIMKYDLKQTHFADLKVNMETENVGELPTPHQDEAGIQDLNNQNGDCGTEHSELPKSLVLSDCSADTSACPLSNEVTTNYLTSKGPAELVDKRTEINIENVVELPQDLSPLNSKVESDTAGQRLEASNCNEGLAIDSENTVDCHNGVNESNEGFEGVEYLDCDKREVAANVENGAPTCINGEGVENGNREVEYELFHLSGKTLGSDEEHNDNLAVCGNGTETASKLNKLPKCGENGFGMDIFGFDFACDPVEENVVEPSPEVSLNCANADGENLEKNDLLDIKSSGVSLGESGESNTFVPGKDYSNAHNDAVQHFDSRNVNVDSEVMVTKEVDFQSMPNIPGETKGIDFNDGEQNAEKYNENSNLSLTSSLKEQSDKWAICEIDEINLNWGRNYGKYDKSEGYSEYRRLISAFNTSERRRKQLKSATVIQELNPKEIPGDETNQVLKDNKKPCGNKNDIGIHPKQKLPKGKDSSRSDGSKEASRGAVPKQKTSSNKKANNKCGANKPPANEMVKESKLPLKMEHSLDVRHPLTSKEIKHAASASSAYSEDEVDHENCETRIYSFHVPVSHNYGHSISSRLNVTTDHDSDAPHHRQPSKTVSNGYRVSCHHDQRSHHRQFNTPCGLHHHAHGNEGTCIYKCRNNSCHHYCMTASHHGRVNSHRHQLCSRNCCRSCHFHMIQPSDDGAPCPHHNRDASCRSVPTLLPAFPFLDQSFNEDDYGEILHEALLLSLSLQ